MASAHQSRYYEQSQREERGLATQQHEESLRDMEQIRHTNATLDVAGSDAFRAQTEQAAIRIVTPHYKIPEKPGTDVQIGSSLQDLSSKLTDAADYRAERAAEHFRMQIIDPRVASHAHIPAHAIRDYARRHLIDDFPSLHGKRSFLDLEALDQLRIRPKGKLGDATDRDKDLDKFLKNRDGKPWELAHPPKVDDDSLRELDRLRNNIDNLQKSSFHRSKSLSELHEAITEQMNEKINLIKELNEKEKKEKDDRLSMINLLNNAQQANEKLVSPPLPSPPPPFQFSRSSDHYSIQSSQFSIENVTASSSEKQSETSSISIFSDDQQFPKEDSKSPVWRRNLFLVADEDGADICEWRFNIKEESLQKNKKMEQGEGGGGQQPWRGIETPTGQPTKSCLKQTPQTSSSPKQQIGNSSYSLHHVGTEPDGESWEDRGEISFDLDKQRLALIQQMQKNLEIHRKHQSPRRYPTVPFDGPFFRLEEVGNNIPGTSTSGGKIPAPPPPPPQGWAPRQSSSQIYEQQSPFNEEEEFDEASGGRVVYWPAPDPKSRLPKQAPPPPKNLRDPERLEEFLRQEQMQKEAEALRLQRETELRDRQFRALQLQQQQQNHVSVPSTSTSNYFPSPPSHPLPDYDDYQQQQNQKNVRVFETRPISAEESLTSPEFATNGQSNRGTWRRTFTLDSRLSRGLTIDERNEILTSDERLIRERFNIDLLKRRESFIEKPEHPPEIQRLGRCWQPPLEQPFKCPTSSTSTQQPLSVQTGVGDAEEYRWAPLIREPTFKKETKRFTPEPESPPIRGHGTGPLDDVAKRQTAGLILPSPDGSHRPRTEFSHIRKPPAGGFMPHAPNVIRVSRAEGKAQKGEIGGGLRRHTSDMKSKEPIEREYLTHNNEDMNGGASSSQYQYNRQLPRHSSTIVQLGPLPRVEVRRRIKLLEARQQQTNHQRSRSAVSHARSGSSAARSPSAQRSLERIQRATAPSPAPASYARARRYIPTALPSGIRQSSDQMSQERPQIPPRHTRQMVEVVQNAAKSHKQIHEPLCAKFVPSTFGTQKQKLEGNGRGIFNEKSQKKIIPPQEEKRKKQLILNEERGGERNQILPSSTDSGEIQSYHSERTVEHRRYTSRS